MKVLYKMLGRLEYYSISFHENKFVETAKIVNKDVKVPSTNSALHSKGTISVILSDPHFKE